MEYCLVLLLIVVRHFSSSSSCLCGGNPKVSDTTSDIICNKMNSFISGVDGKSVGQCHDVIIKHKKIPPWCKIKHYYDPSDDQSLLHSAGHGYVMYRIFNPEYYSHNQLCYSNKLFCVYNVQCAPNQFLYYHYSTHDIEDPQPSGQCLDMIIMTRDSIPNYEPLTCGRVGINGKTYTDYGISQSGYEAQRLKVKFRSNTKCAASGYFLWVLCVNMTEQYTQGCNNMDTFIPIRKRGVTKDGNDDEFKIIPFDGTLEYDSSTLMIVTVAESLEYSNVVSLTVISTDKERKRFVTYKSSNISKTFYGEGKLYVTCGFGNTSCTAVYQMTGVPLSYQLNAKQERNVDKLLSTLVPYFKQDSDYYRVNPSNNSSFDFQSQTKDMEKSSLSIKLTRPQLPNKREFDRKIARRIAINNRNSCNAIVKSVSNFFLKIEQEKQQKI